MELLMTLVALLAQQGPLDTSTYDLWVAALAILTVVATSAISQLPPSFTELHKRIIAATVSGVLAVVGVYYQGLLDTADWARTWLLVFMAATALYVVIVKPATAMLQERTT
jgi:hypothetical protein